VDTAALLALATSGAPNVFLGSDSAPHPQARKESACCAAGVYSGPAVLEHYAMVFEAAGALPRLEHFAASAGADFYGLPRNRKRVTLEKRPWTMPATVPFGETVAVPWRAGEMMSWQVVDVS
jgi:dihydroorotase